MAEHPASERGGWAVRWHETDGSSWLNNYSLGDVVAYDSEAEAVAAGIASMTRYRHMVSTGRRFTVEAVEKGAHQMSMYEAREADLTERLQIAREALLAIRGAVVLWTPGDDRDEMIDAGRGHLLREDER